MYKYLEMVINKSENLKDPTLGLKRKCDVINREISAGKEKIRVKLKIYETCLMPALLHELEVWGKVGKDGMNEIKKVQGRVLRTIFNLPTPTSYIGLIMETGA